MSDWAQLHEDPSAPSLSGSAPSGVPQSGGMNLDVLMQNIAGTGPSAGLVNAANTPVSGGHTGQVPSAFMRQVQPFQAQPMNSQKVVGKHAAKMQGVGNVITAATNAIGSFMSMKAQQKQDQTKDAATKVLQTQSALDEATQQKESAEAMMKNTTGAEYETNKKIFDTATAKVEAAKKQQAQLFADPKLGKSLVKGFNINHTDPSLNNTDEHKAVISAMQEFKNAKDNQSKQAAQQTLQQAQGAENAMLYRQQSPQSAGAPNTMAQVQVAAAQAQQKIRQEAIKDYRTFTAAMAGHQATVTAAQLRVQGQLLIQQGAINHQQDMLNQRITQADKMFEKHKNLEFSLIDAREKAARELADDVYSDKEADPLTMYTKSNAALLKYQDNLSKNQNTLTSLMQERQKFYPGGGAPGAFHNKAAVKDPEGYQALNVQIALTQQQIKQNQQMVQNLQQQSEQIKTAAGLMVGGVSDGRTDSNSTDESSLGTEPDYTDPANYTDQSDSQ